MKTGRASGAVLRESELVRRAAGTYVDPPPSPEIPLLAFFQAACRHGVLREELERLCESMPERPDPGLAWVEHVDSTHVRGSIPCRVSDHESKSTVLVDVPFQLALRADFFR